MLTLVITSLTPLAESHDVEIHERLRNLLGLAQLAQEEISSHHDRKDLQTSIMVRLITDAILEDFGPVPFSAQERVLVPNGLVLEENLSKLDSICADVQLPVTESFSLVKPILSPTDEEEEETEISAAESTSLLAEHRKRHGLFYLPSDNNKNASSSFPPANDPNQRDDDVEDLVKLTEESLVLKRKANHGRPRPVVVKLDEGDRLPTTAKKTDENDDLISGAVRDVLLGSEASLPSGRRKGKSHSSETGNSSKTRSKHRKHGKNVEGNEENGEKNKPKNGGRHKSRRRADGGGDVAVQKPVIPDFLL